MDPLAAELALALATLQRRHDVLPFIHEILVSGETRLAEVPPEMLALLKESGDFESVRPGEPVWMQIASEEGRTAEIVLYRAEANGRYFMVAPPSR